MNRVKSRYKIILAIVITVVLFAALFSLYGYHNTLRLWNIPTYGSSFFADIRTVIVGAEVSSEGLDSEFWGSKVDYPRIWQGLHLLGIREGHTTAMGIGIILLFLIGVCLFLPNASNTTVLLVLAALLSPAVLLGVERANVNLLLFFLVSVAIITAQRSYLLSTLAILSGFALKLYPIFGLAVLLKAKRSKFLLYTLISLVFVGCYTFLIYPNLLSTGKMLEARIGYGIGVFIRILGDHNVNLGRAAKGLSYLSVIASSAFALSALFRKDNPSVRKEDDIYLSAFRAGASIYIGTFLMSNNFPYKLIFLIFTIPQLILWAKYTATNISIISKSTIIAVFISMWYLVISKLLGHFPWYINFTVNALSNWIILFCCMYLIFWSMPAWVKEVVQRK